MNEKINECKSKKVKIALILLSISLSMGCKNTKFLNKEEKKYSNELINYLSNNYENINFKFLSKSKAYNDNCSCNGFYLLGSCFGRKKCEEIKGYSVWNYKGCIENTQFCQIVSYDEFFIKWTYTMDLEVLEEVANIIKMLKENNIKYRLYSGTSNTLYTLAILKSSKTADIIKKIDNNENVKEYISNRFNIIILEDLEYSILEKNKNNIDVIDNYILYGIISSTTDIVLGSYIIENEINDNMFTFNNTYEYKYISYEYIVYNNNSKIKIVGFN